MFKVEVGMLIQSKKKKKIYRLPFLFLGYRLKFYLNFIKISIFGSSKPVSEIKIQNYFSMTNDYCHGKMVLIIS